MGLAITSFMAQSQVIFNVTSPSSIEGNYPLTYSKPSSGWGSPDLTLPANAVTGEVVFARSSGAGDSLACSAIANAAAVNGKIALIYRGDCEFGVKAKNAAQAGAIAIIIVNNNPAEDPIEMSPGSGTPAPGASVTVPVIMTNTATGNAIAAKLRNSETVNAFIGNKVGFYGDDLGTNAASTLSAPAQGMPHELAKNTTEFPLNPKMYVHNYGSNDQTDVVATATITFGGNSVYTETVTVASIESGDSALVEFPNYSNTNLQAGNYELKYEIVMAGDEYPADNAFTYKFSLTSDLYSLARVENNLPANSGGSRLATFVSEFRSCVFFKNQNGSRLGAKGLHFLSTVDAGESLEGEEVTVQALKWNDVFTDLDDPNLGMADLEEVAYTSYIYPAGKENQFVYADFDEPFLLEDNQRYLFCLQTANPDIYFGYDTKLDYTMHQLYIANETVSPVKSDNWALRGFGLNNVAAIGLKTILPAELGVFEQNTIEVSAFPNPAKDVVNITLNGTAENASLTITDVAGKIVSSSTVNTNEVGTIKVSTSELTNGIYIFNLVTKEGASAKFNVSVIR